MQYAFSLGREEQAEQRPMHVERYSTYVYDCRIQNFSAVDNSAPMGRVDLVVESAPRATPCPLNDIRSFHGLRLSNLFRTWSSALSNQVASLSRADASDELDLRLQIAIHVTNASRLRDLEQWLNGENMWYDSTIRFFLMNVGEILTYDQSLRVYTKSALSTIGQLRVNRAVQNPQWLAFVDREYVRKPAEYAKLDLTEVSLTQQDILKWNHEYPLLPHQLQTVRWMASIERGATLHLQHRLKVANYYLQQELPIGSDDHLQLLLRPSVISSENPLWTTHAVRGGVVANDVGTGKSATLLALAASAKPWREGLDCTLLIVNINLLQQWKREIEKFLPQARVLLLSDQRKFGKQSRETIAQYDYILTTLNFLTSSKYCRQLRNAADEVTGSRLATLTKTMNVRALRQLPWNNLPLPSAPMLESFYWRRVVVDEIHEIATERYQEVPWLRCKSFWGLSASASDALVLRQLSHFFARPLDSDRQVSVPNPVQKFIPPLLRRSFEAAQLPPYDHQVMRVQMSVEELTLARSFDSVAEEISVLTCFNGSNVSSTCHEFVELRSAAEVGQLVLHRIEEELTLARAGRDSMADVRQALEYANDPASVAALRHGIQRHEGLVEIVSSLEQRKRFILDSLKLMEAGGECPVCMSAQVNALPPCGHAFCHACLGRVAERAPSCPVCRAAFRRDEVTYVAPVRSELGNKTQAIVDVLGQIVAQKDRVVVFVQWITLLKALATCLKRSGINFEVMRGNAQTRHLQLQRFQTGERSVLLLALEQSNAGLDLSCANHVIFSHCIVASSQRSRELRRQAIARVHRMGQKSKVTVYDFVAEDSIEIRLFNEQIVHRS